MPATVSVERTEAKIADIRRKIESLVAMREARSELIVACSSRRPTKGCPILDSLDANGRFERQPGGHHG
jgi:hypothetical protein